jgi:hypothetical protein
VTDVMSGITGNAAIAFNPSRSIHRAFPRVVDFNNLRKENWETSSRPSRERVTMNLSVHFVNLKRASMYHLVVISHKNGNLIV